MADRLEEIKEYLTEVSNFINNAPPELPGIILFPKFSDTGKSCVYVNGSTEHLTGIIVQLMRQSEEMTEIFREALDQVEA